jgi:hypothetical protein
MESEMSTWRVGSFAMDAGTSEGARKAAQTRKQHHPDVHASHQQLSRKSTVELLKMHHQMNRVTSKHTAAEVGGKQGMISDLLRARHGNRKVAEHFGLEK